MTKIAIALLVAAAIIGVLVVYSCCVVAGRADDAAEEIWRNRHGSANKPAGRDYR